ncbi:MAG: hypothetical protein WCO52_05960 [bacterium]
MTINLLFGILGGAIVIGLGFWWWKNMPNTVNSAPASPSAGTPHGPPSNVPPGGRPNPSDVGGTK